MDITPAIPTGKKIITGYGGGTFKINNEIFGGNIIVYPDSVISWHNHVSNIIAETLQPILERPTDIEILIIGCGIEHQQLSKDIAVAFRNKGISVDIMATGPACRTYNVLLAEGRQVVAALVAI